MYKEVVEDNEEIQNNKDLSSDNIDAILRNGSLGNFSFLLMSIPWLGKLFERYLLGISLPEAKIAQLNQIAGLQTYDQIGALLKRIYQAITEAVSSTVLAVVSPFIVFIILKLFGPLFLLVAGHAAPPVVVFGLLVHVGIKASDFFDAAMNYHRETWRQSTDIPTVKALAEFELASATTRLVTSVPLVSAIITLMFLMGLFSGIVAPPVGLTILLIIGGVTAGLLLAKIISEIILYYKQQALLQKAVTKAVENEIDVKGLLGLDNIEDASYLTEGQLKAIYQNKISTLGVSNDETKAKTYLAYQILSDPRARCSYAAKQAIKTEFVDKNIDCYATLGVENKTSTASKQQITGQYQTKKAELEKQLISPIVTVSEQFDSDKHKKETNQKLKQLDDAYKILSHEEYRCFYDQCSEKRDNDLREALMRAQKKEEGKEIFDEIPLTTEEKKKEEVVEKTEKTPELNSNVIGVSVSQPITIPLNSEGDKKDNKNEKNENPTAPKSDLNVTKSESNIHETLTFKSKVIEGLSRESKIFVTTSSENISLSRSFEERKMIASRSFEGKKEGPLITLIPTSEKAALLPEMGFREQSQDYFEDKTEEVKKYVTEKKAQFQKTKEQLLNKWQARKPSPLGSSSPVNASAGNDSSEKTANTASNNDTPHKGF